MRKVSPEQQRKDRRSLRNQRIIGIVVTILAAAALLLLSLAPAFAQEAAPASPAIVQLELGYSVVCPGFRVNIIPDLPMEMAIDARCGVDWNPAERVYVDFTCGNTTGLIQAYDKRDYSGKADVTVYVGQCDLGPPSTLDQTPCPSDTGKAFVNTPVYWDIVHANVSC